MLGAILLVSGCALVALVLLDAVVTTLSTTSRAGPMTRETTRGVWRMALALHGRRPSHRLLIGLGPGLLVLGLAQWLGLLWVGWTLVFVSQDATLVVERTGEEAGLLDAVYFAGASLLSLGTGDIVAATPGWRTISVIATGTGLFTLTLSLAYFISVVSAATDRRVLAWRLSALGETPEEILIRAWRGDRFSPELGIVLSGFAEPTVRLAQQHVTYHVLHYFHVGDPAHALVLGLARLDDALLLLEYAVAADVRPDPLPARLLRAHLRHLIDTVGDVHRTMPTDDAPPPPGTARLLEAGIPLAPAAELDAALGLLADRRRAVAALVASDGWTWDDVVTQR